MNKARFNKFATIFWWAYILLPMFTGMLAYDWLPNESYDADKHELLVSHTVETGTEGMVSAESPDSWKSLKTGNIYNHAMFEEHHKAEKWHVAVKLFLYGLIGCFVYAYGQHINEHGKYFESFKKAVMCNFAIAFAMFVLI